MITKFLKIEDLENEKVKFIGFNRESKESHTIGKPILSRFVLYQSGEVNCDYGLISTLGATLTTTNTVDTTNVLKNCQSLANHTLESVDLGVLPMGTYTFYIKFRKDGS